MYRLISRFCFAIYLSIFSVFLSVFACYDSGRISFHRRTSESSYKMIHQITKRLSSCHKQGIARFPQYNKVLLNIIVYYVIHEQSIFPSPVHFILRQFQKFPSLFLQSATNRREAIVPHTAYLS